MPQKWGWQMPGWQMQHNRIEKLENQEVQLQQLSLWVVEEGLSHIRSRSNSLAKLWYQAEPNSESLETDLEPPKRLKGYESRMNVFWPCELLLATKYCYYTAKKTLKAACGRLHNGRNRYAAAGRVTTIGGSNWCYPAMQLILVAFVVHTSTGTSGS